MRYEVRIAGASIGVFAEAEEALECCRRALAENPGEEPEIIDMETGHAYDPAHMFEDGEDVAPFRAP
jgi:hypothetical protein